MTRLKHLLRYIVYTTIFGLSSPLMKFLSQGAYYTTRREEQETTPLDGHDHQATMF